MWVLLDVRRDGAHLTVGGGCRIEVKEQERRRVTTLVAEKSEKLSNLRRRLADDEESQREYESAQEDLKRTERELARLEGPLQGCGGCGSGGTLVVVETLSLLSHLLRLDDLACSLPQTCRNSMQKRSVCTRLRHSVSRMSRPCH